jgi:hypothetical protein
MDHWSYEYGSFHEGELEAFVQTVNEMVSVNQALQIL